jgi:hypothetical protein
MSFETQHYFIVEKEEKGIVFAKCIRHVQSEYGIGKRKGEYVGMVYIGKDKQQAEKIYLDLLSQY